MYELTKKKRPLWLKVVIFLLICSVTSELLKAIFSGPTLDESLVKTSSEINKQCPIVVDSITRLDNTSVLAGKYLVYNYTLLQRGQEIRADTTYYKNNMRESLITMIKTNPRLKEGQKSQAGFIATWYDSVGAYICSLAIAPEDYK